MYIPLQIPPGVYKNGTDYQSQGRWNDANLVRWYEGTMRPVGGWRKRQTTQLSGRPSGIISWRDNDNERWIAVGTHTKLYIINQAGAVKEITPTGLTAGDADAVAKIGYGFSVYGAFAYGVERPDLGSFTPATTWSLDTWGEYLIACSSADGKIYEWELGFATPDEADVIATAPEDNQAILVTDERFLFALGAGGNPRKVQWSDQEDNTTWTPSTLNQAGDFELTSVGTLQCGKRFRGTALLFTDVDVHVATYIGPPFVYSFERAGTGCGVISKQAVGVNDNAAIWMSKSGFWLYDGYVKPLPSEVADYVFSNINMSQSSKVYCMHNSQFGEMWWFYPSASSTENDSYVLYNYRENHWSIGLLDRTAGTDSGVYPTPLIVSPDGYVYEHETGFDYNGDKPYAESGPLELGTGERVLSCNELIPDEKTQGDVRAFFSTRFYPNAPEFLHGPYSLANPTPVRVTGRQLALKIEGVTLSSWRFGSPRLNVVVGGKR